MQRNNLKRPRRFKLLETVFYTKPGEKIPFKTYIVSTRQEDDVESYHIAGVGPKVYPKDLLTADKVKGNYYE